MNEEYKIINDIKEIKQTRRELKEKLESEIRNTNSYKEKFILIYKIILTSQFHYANDILNIDIFSEDNFKKLLNEFNSIDNMDDIKFYEFIRTNLIVPLNFGHLGIKFENEYINKFISIYRYLQDSENIEIKAFLSNYNLYNDISELLKTENIDSQKFEDFAREKFGCIISKEELIKPKEDNLTIDYIGDTVVLKIRSFAQSNIENDKIKFDMLEKELQNNDYNNIIIDIRDNLGGSDSYFEMFSIFSNEDVDYEMKYYDLFNNYIDTTNDTYIHKGTDKQYNKYLLVNGKVFSAAEGLSKICKKTGFATIIGENTRGEYGYNGYPININTEIPMLLRFPVDAPLNDFNQIDYKNCYNTIPDVYCESENALDIALQMTGKNKKLGV